MDAREIALAKIAAAPVPTAEEILHAREVNGRSKRNGGDRRGGAERRRRRTERLLEEFGDGETCPCVYCGTELNAVTVTHDKIYTGDMGGSYKYTNILPSCLACNQRRSDRAIDEFIAEANAAIKHAEEMRSNSNGE